MTCRHENSEIVLEAMSHKLFQCRSCGIISAKKKEQKYLEPEKIYENYYEKEKASRFSSPVELIVKAFRLIRAFKIHILVPQGKSVLDIGSGRGWMLYFLKKYFN